MIYVILELQTNTNGTIGSLINTYTNEQEAESKYHMVLASAAVSALPVHSAVMLTNSGKVIKSESYEHDVPIED